MNVPGFFDEREQGEASGQLEQYIPGDEVMPPSAYPLNVPITASDPAVLTEPGLLRV